MIATQAKSIGIDATLLGVDGTDGVLAIEGADTSVLDGLYFSNHYFDADTAEKVQTFCNN
jgi:branched-chain amino acid transport system substrate-binding protein